MSCFYLFVEGTHDCAAVSKILSLYGFKEILKLRDVPSFLLDIIPTRYPFDADILDRVSHAPTILHRRSDNKYVAIKVAIGDSKITKAVYGMSEIKMEYVGNTSGVGIILDADDNNIEVRLTKIIAEINKLSLSSKDDSSLYIEDNKITIREGIYRFSTYVMPNNRDKGTLEDVLIDGAERNYCDLLIVANTYRESLPQQYYIKLAEKPSVMKKALVGFISNVLKPGRANQVSINDCDWFTHDSLQHVEKHRLLFRFLNDCIGL
jgi:hypothetical protein